MTLGVTWHDKYTFSIRSKHFTVQEKIIQQPKRLIQKAGVMNDPGIFHRRCEEQSALSRTHRRRDEDSSLTPR